MTTIRTTLFAAFALTLAAPAFADGFVVEVHGNYNTTARVGNVQSNANGQNAKADINVVGVQGGALVDYTANATTGSISTSATGQNASSLSNIGGIQGYHQ
ncbi:MAG: hypothetical protein DM484_26860 [Candidatus Methylumidiphilus alinenensis]|uniref:Curlin n=1 Tax=Candidatus Methylumidiphilus alinenensis TaxID=2202197 RepID=A0A2W4QLF1_9GAMM|nr:MAG: hypothetical protein DM484_26860 [Candidatus Methylumidiphilus alinenensis]